MRGSLAHAPGWVALALALGCVPRFEPLGECLRDLECGPGGVCSAGRCARVDAGVPSGDAGLEALDGGARPPDAGPFPDDDLVLVGAGAFVMGSPEREVEGSAIPEPQALVEVGDLHVMVREVTQDDWKVLLGERPVPEGLPCEVGSRGGRGECPVGSVTPALAFELANAMSRHLGLAEECYEAASPGAWTFRGAACAGARLPTADEWEYVARAGVLVAHHGRPLPAGWSSADVAWCEANARRKVRPAGQLGPNPGSLRDVLGNVAEWVHRADLTTDLALRGGSACSAPFDCRFAALDTRCPELEGLPHAGLRLVIGGFTGGATHPPPGFVFRPGGAFVRGSPPASEEGRRPDEHRHRVTLARPFWLARFEVTLAGWRAVTGTDHASAAGQRGCPDDCPVRGVTWTEAAGFANALSRLRGLEPCYALSGTELTPPAAPGCTGYRLPTEAEWEYAARAGATDARPGDVATQAWTSIGLPAGEARRAPTAAGRFAANAFGLKDMLGNVREWVEDDEDPYPVAPVIEPPSPSPSRFMLNPRKLARGCGYPDGEADCRFARRFPLDPSVTDAAVGFRLARTATAAGS